MKILLAIDGSPSSDAAIREVAHLAPAAGTIVHVITVEARIEASMLRGSPTVFDELMKQYRANAAQRLNAAAALLKSLAPDLTVLPKLLEGNAKDVIVTEAQQRAVDLVVVGSHGYGPIRQFFLGSVSLYVAHNAPCSVLIARCKPNADPA